MHPSQTEGHGRGGDRGSGRAPVQAAALGRGLRHGLTALPNVVQKKGETKQALSHRAGCFVELHLALHYCSKVGGVYSRYSQDTRS